MAEAFQKLREQLTCAVCIDDFVSPKQLECNHIFCEKCLVRLVNRGETGELTLTCPTCREISPVPGDAGVAGLRSAFHINHLLEIRDTLSMICTPAAAVGKGEGNDACGLTASGNAVNPAMLCLEHVEELKLFCSTCDVLICCQCAIKGSKHHHCEYELVEKAFEAYERELTVLLDPMEKQLAIFNKALEEVECCRKEISSQQTSMVTSINHMIRKLQDILEVRRTQLVHDVQKIAGKKLKTLAAQRDHLEFSKTRLASCLEFLKGSMQERRKGEMLNMKAKLKSQIKELTLSFEQSTLKPNAEADIVYCAASNAIQVLQTLGEVYTPKSLCPKKCRALNEFEMGTVGVKSVNLIQACNWKGDPCREQVDLLQCELISELTGEVVIGDVKKRGQGQYEISYQPIAAGRHQLHVKVDDTHISGSPFAIAVKTPMERLGAPISTISGVHGPWGLAVNKRGEVILTESSTHSVSIINQSREKLTCFGTLGSGFGQFDKPRGVTVLGNGEILVADRNNHRIQKFTAGGQFINAVGSEGKSQLEFSNPRGIAFNPANSKVYVTDYNHRVQILNSDLTFSSVFGRYGSSKGHFDCPCGIACDRTGKVYVADCCNHRIQVFTQDGKFLLGFGHHGEGKGDVNFPVGVAVDSSSIVYVTGFKDHSISVFTAEGEFVTSFGKEGKGPGEFTSPLSVVVDYGALYVCDHKNDCIQIF